MVNETKWESKLPEFERRLTRDWQAIHDGVVELAYNSIVYGSVMANTQGQPADLREGQFETVKNGPLETTIGTNDPSARSVEDGISYKHGGVPITLKSPIGGTHSVKKTEQAGDKIIKAVTKRVVRRG